jgi:hypothetical protein
LQHIYPVKAENSVMAGRRLAITLTFAISSLALILTLLPRVSTQTDSRGKYRLTGYHHGTMNSYPPAQCLINESRRGYAAYGSVGIGENIGQACRAQLFRNL